MAAGTPEKHKLLAPLANPWARGWGGSRREAEQQAARQALATLQDRP